ncbi:hypothetical protein Tco_0699098 [Tanacetum coccineum]
MNTSVNVNSFVAMNDSVNYVEKCNKCLELKAELIKQHNIVEKDEYNRLSKSFSKLEQHCISLELAMQLNKEIFQKNITYVNQTEPTFDHLFELNNLKAELQCKNTTSKKKRFRKLKGKDKDDNAAQVLNTTFIAPGMYKLDQVTLAHMDTNNWETHIYYLKQTMEQSAILREIVEQAKSLNPLDSASYSACKYVKLIQVLLGYVRDTCLDIHKPSEKLVDVTPINKKKTVRHELCFLEFDYDMNACSKSKYVKKAKKKEEWKPTGKVFTKTRYNWRPTGRTFTLVGNACPLTRITATNEVPLRELFPLEVLTRTIVTKVFTRRPKFLASKDEAPDFINQVSENDTSEMQESEKKQGKKDLKCGQMVVDDVVLCMMLARGYEKHDFHMFSMMLMLLDLCLCRRLEFVQKTMAIAHVHTVSLTKTLYNIRRWSWAL